MLNCEFSEPRYWDRSALDLLPLDDKISELDVWNFTKMDCSGDLDYSTTTFPAYIERIENDDQNFFLQKTISYGDFLMIAFFIVFFVGFSIMGIRDFVKNRKLERL